MHESITSIFPVRTAAALLILNTGNRTRQLRVLLLICDGILLVQRVGMVCDGLGHVFYAQSDVVHGGMQIISAAVTRELLIESEAGHDHDALLLRCFERHGTLRYRVAWFCRELLLDFVLITEHADNRPAIIVICRRTVLATHSQIERGVAALGLPRLGIVWRLVVVPIAVRVDVHLLHLYADIALVRVPLPQLLLLLADTSHHFHHAVVLGEVAGDV